ncbi:MAG: hypothetical protein ACOVVP_11815 [Pseudanabaena sp.]
MPEEISQLTNLTILNLSAIQIAVIPDAIGNLSKIATKSRRFPMRSPN